MPRVCRRVAPQVRLPARPGSFLQEANAGGNFVPVIGKPATLAQGQTPILINSGLQRAFRAATR